MDTYTIIFTITIAVSVVAAAILLILSGATSRPKVKVEEEKKSEPEHGVPDLVISENLRQSVFKEVNEVVGSKRLCQEITERVSMVFDKELDVRIEVNNRQKDKEHKSAMEERKRSEELAWGNYDRLFAEHRETEAVVYSMAEGLVVVDSHGNVLMMNPAAEKLLGVSKKDMLGRPILDNVKKEQLISLIKDSPGSGKKEIDIEMASEEDETKKILRSSNAIIEGKDGQMIGMVSVLSDVTKQKELENIKREFVSSVTHKLRTPLIVSEKALSLLRDKEAGKITKKREDEFLSLAEDNVKKLSGLIKDLLDLSNLEEGKQELKRELAAVEKVIDESIGNLAAWAEAKSIVIEKNIQEDMPKAKIDADRIGQVMNNLLGNAIRFTPENGRIGIAATIEKDKDELTITVEDTGIGIKSENLPKIFDRFYQVSERAPSDLEGTGIGLSIAKKIVELHGGTIWAESEKNKGARITFKVKTS